MELAELEPGLKGSARMIVTAADAAPALGSGDVPVLGTPRLVALCEEATVAAVRHVVPVGLTTVGTRIEIDHLKPTPVGGRVWADALLAAVEGRRLRFEVSVADDGGTVALAAITRVVVDRERFLSGLGTTPGSGPT